MRITQQMQTTATMAGLQYTQSKLSDLQAQLSSGRSITKPSDDPSGTVNALALRAELKRNTQYQTNASDANAWLSTVDTAVQGVNTALTSVRTSVVKALNGGTADTASLSAISAQIDSVKEQVLQYSNATYLGRPVFGGTTANSAAFVENQTTGVVTYQGDSNAVTRDVGPNATVQLSQSNGTLSNGEAVFGKAGTSTYTPDSNNQPVGSVFELLTSISAKVKAGTVTGNDLSDLDKALATVKAAQAQEGASTNRVQLAQTTAQSTDLALKSRLSDIQDVDIADMAIKISAADLAYQASMQVTAKVSSRSLMDFIS